MHAYTSLFYNFNQLLPVMFFVWILRWRPKLGRSVPRWILHMLWRTTLGFTRKSSKFRVWTYSDIFVALHDFFYSCQGELMVFEKVDISGHFVDFFLNLLEFGIDVFVISIELGLTLDAFFLLFCLYRDFIHS